jgi:hypothetical protein
VLFVVAGEDGLIELAQLHRRDGEVLLLEAGDDLPDELALHGIGLEQDKRAFHVGGFSWM